RRGGMAAAAHAGGTASIFGLHDAGGAARARSGARRRGAVPGRRPEARDLLVAAGSRARDVAVGRPGAVRSRASGAGPAPFPARAPAAIAGAVRAPPAGRAGRLAMNGEHKLKVVGYWYDPFGRTYWPDPATLVDPYWEMADRSRIVGYLQSGTRIHKGRGYAYFRFAGGPSDEEIGRAELTDGVWLWPEALSIYVERYLVKLPDDLVRHMRANQFRVPRRHLNPFLLEDAPLDFDYWTRWSR